MTSTGDAIESGDSTRTIGSLASFVHSGLRTFADALGHSSAPAPVRTSGPPGDMALAHGLHLEGDTAYGHVPGASHVRIESSPWSASGSAPAARLGLQSPQTPRGGPGGQRGAHHHVAGSPLGRSLRVCPS